jgi:hypothetical protein
MDSAIGHNNPPTMAEETAARLAEEYAALAARVQQALAGVTVPESVDSDADAVAVNVMASALLDVGRDVEAAKRNERRPLKDADNAVVKHFADMVAPLSATMALMQSRVRSYQLAKAQAVRKAARAFGAGDVEAKDAGRILTADGRVAVAAQASTIYRISDESLIPRDLMRPDAVLINARIARLKAEGAPLEIPGLIISEEIRTSWRHKPKR